MAVRVDFKWREGHSAQYHLSMKVRTLVLPDLRTWGIGARSLYIGSENRYSTAKRDRLRIDVDRISEPMRNLARMKVFRALERCYGSLRLTNAGRFEQVVIDNITGPVIVFP